MKRKLRVLKARGGKDASKDDFKTPAQAFTPSPGDTGGEGGNVTNTITNTNNQKGPGRVTKHPPNIPVIGPLTAGYNIIKNLVAGKKTHPFSANTIKQTKTKPPMGGGGGDRGPQLCPDGTMPPCKTTPIVKPNQANKSNFLNEFKTYNKGGGVPYGPPPSRGPNSQVPPIKFSRGGGVAIKGIKFKGVF